jgi:hypothetical protein
LDRATSLGFDPDRVALKDAFDKSTLTAAVLASFEHAA